MFSDGPCKLQFNVGAVRDSWITGTEEKPKLLLS